MHTTHPLPYRGEGSLSRGFLSRGSLSRGGLYLVGVPVQGISVQGDLCLGVSIWGSLLGKPPRQRPLDGTWDQRPLELTWDQGARQEVTSYRDPLSPHEQND